MAQKVEYRRNAGQMDVYVNGQKTFTCDEVQFSRSVIQDGTGKTHQFAIVLRTHERFGKQSSITFDGQAPREEDWFQGTIGQSFTQVPDGLTFCSSSKGFITFSWPSR